MLSIENIRENPDEVRRALRTRGEEDPITEVLELDAQIRRAITERDDLNAERNRVSKEIGRMRSQGQEASDDVRAEMRKIGGRADALNQRTKDLGDQINSLLLELPNLPQPDVPVGEDESGSIIVRQSGEPPAARPRGPGGKQGGGARRGRGPPAPWGSAGRRAGWGRPSAR